MVKFNPLDINFKKPIGAQKAGESAYFRIAFTRPSAPEDVYLCLTKDGEDEVRYAMEFCEKTTLGEFSYCIDLSVECRGLYTYHFIVHTKKDEIYIGSDEELNAVYGKGREWQLTVFDGFITPSWMDSGVMYQIFVDRFNVGEPRLKTKKGMVYREDWGNTPVYLPNKEGKIVNNDLFGGNLRGIIKKLGYLKTMGVTTIYLNPIFEARSNHKYDTSNYRRVDPDFGTNEELVELVKKADKKGMRVILDGVFSHTGDDSIYFNKYGTYDTIGAYQSKESPYYPWYRFTDFDKKEYECWWNFDTLPNCEENNPSYNEFINGPEGVIDTWIKMGIGGWRLDVADELPDEFLDNLYRAAKRANPEAIVMGEVWEDASNKESYGKRRRFLNGGQMDSVMNYPFKEAILEYAVWGNSKALRKAIITQKNNYPECVRGNLMNLLSTHDTARILTVLGGKDLDADVKVKAKSVLEGEEMRWALAKLKIAVTLLFMLPGVPCIYYGDELGMQGHHDPLNRGCFVWEKRNSKVLKLHRTLGKLRESNKELFKYGEFEILKSADSLFFCTWNFGKQKITALLNNSDEDFNYVTGGELVDILTNKLYTGVVKKRDCVVLMKENI
ncbi:MAG: glycoside hydrolase family 13 protein [Firmicutes bacterium]|nr:glycoside hydrolase family 13 protein [Bacillota bacterium]